MATATSRFSRVPEWIAIAGPFALIGVMVVVFIALNPVGSLRPVPPVEEIAFERTVLRPGTIELRVRNDGPDPVTIAQVLVDDAYWGFDTTDRTLDRLRGATITLDYPWDEGLPLTITLVTSTGGAIEHEIPVAAETPEADASTLGIYGLLGVYIGVVPVAIGLLWFPALRRAGRRWIVFFLAFTVGLLVFLLVDTVGEGLELAAETAAVFDGLGLFAIGALGAIAVLLLIGNSLDRRTSGRGTGTAGAGFAGLTLAYMIAAGIGLHNLGEGLAVGAALAAGEAALGTFLVLGFALHNTTEGLAIVAPLGSANERPSMWHFAGLGAVAGVPTILGAWMGGFAFAPAWGALAFGVGAGAIAQVVWTIGRSMTKDSRAHGGMVTGGFMAGLALMYVTALFTA